jgi:hypothetical protein
MAPKFKDGDVVASVSFALSCTRRIELTRCSLMANGFPGFTQSSHTVCAQSLLFEFVPGLIITGAFVGALIVGRSSWHMYIQDELD